MQTLTQMEWYTRFLDNLLAIQQEATTPLELNDYLKAAKGEL